MQKQANRPKEEIMASVYEKVMSTGNIADQNLVAAAISGVGHGIRIGLDLRPLKPRKKRKSA